MLTAPSGAESESVELPMLEKNTAYAKENGEWTVSHRPTPGYSNDDAGYEAWLRSGGYENDEIYITEVMAQNRGTLADSDGDLSDWIEIANLGETSVDLAGWYLSDDPDVPDEWKIPSLTLAPGEYAVIFASGKNRTGGACGNHGIGFAVFNQSLTPDNRRIRLGADRIDRVFIISNNF